MAGRGALCFRRGALRYEGGGGGVGDGGGAPCWALLPPGLGRLGPNVIEDVLGGSSSRCRRGAGFGFGLGLGCGLRSWRADGFGWLSGAGLRALGRRGSSGGAEGSRTRWTPVTAVTSCVRRKVCTPSRAAGAGRGGRGTGAALYGWVGVIPGTRSGSPRVATTRRSRGVPGRSCQRTCPLWWAPLVLERGGDRFRLAQPRGACVAGGRAEQQVGSLGNASHMTAYRGGRPGAVVHRVGRAGAGARLVRTFHEYRDFANLQVLVRRMYKVECRVQLGHSSFICGPCLVQVRGRVPVAARPEGVQQGWGAAVEGHGGPRARQPQGVPHGQGPA